VRLLLAGFGNVARTLARILADRRAYPGLAGLDVSVVGITTASRGALVNPAGIELARALDEIRSRGRFTEEHPDHADVDTLTAIGTLAFDVLVELTPLSVRTRGEPAISHVRLALERGRDVVSANKGPLAWAYGELTALAREKGSALLHEATVMDGAPVFGLARRCLRGNTILRIEGVLNSTTNVVLCEMEKGRSLEEAVAAARSLGVAEADPANDLDGWDAAVKIAVLANALMGAELTPELVGRESVTSVGRARIALAASRGRRIKMVSEISREGAGVHGSVTVREVELSDPFARVEGTASVVRLSTDILGALVIAQEAPDLAATAYGVIADLFELQEAGRPPAAPYH